MGHKSFAIALVLGLFAVPLACGSDDDTNPATGGAGGSGAKGGTGGKTGTAGAGGKTGTAGKGGSPGAAGEGEGGSGDTGNVGGQPGAGAGGDSDPGAGAGGMGSGGEAGGGSDPAAVRLAQCKTICNYPAHPDGPGGTKPPMQCLGDANKCATDLCESTGWSASCLQTLDDLLACIPTADADLFYCSAFVDADTLEGTLSIDFAADGKCPDVFTAWTKCIQ
jgi:hypothetical protein